MEEDLKCTIVHGRPRHPQSQGVVERANRSLKNRIQNFSRWSEEIQNIVSSYNSIIHSSTGFPPNKMEGIHKIANQKLKKTADRMLKYDRKSFSQEININDVVLVKRPEIQKLSKKNHFNHQGRVTAILNENSFAIEWITKGYLSSHSIGSISFLPIIQLKKVSFHEATEF